MNAQAMQPQPTVSESEQLPPAHKTKIVPRSTLVSRNVTINGHRTSVRLEPEMWTGLSEICRREHATPHEVCSAIAGHKIENTSLTAAIRVFVMRYFRAAATEDGHAKVGHGHGITIGVASVLAQAVMTGKPPVAPANTSIVRATPSPFMIGANRMNAPKNRTW